MSVAKKYKIVRETVNFLWLEFVLAKWLHAVGIGGLCFD